MTDRSYFDIDASRRAHPTWWSLGSMRFFGTRVNVCTEALVTVDGEPGCVFVTSEVSPGGRRGYCVRLHTATTCKTLGSVCQYATRSGALAALERFHADHPWKRDDGGHVS